MMRARLAATCNINTSTIKHAMHMKPFQLDPFLMLELS